MKELRKRCGPTLPLLLLAAALWLAGPAGGTGEAVQTGGPWTNPPERFVLATGIPCIYQKDAASATTVVGLFIAGGKSAVPAGLDGLAAIATRLLLEIPDEGKVRDLMVQATRLSYICVEDFSIVLIECLTENLDEALRVAAKIIQDPLISGLRVGRAKDLMTANLKAEADDAVAAARSAVFRAFFDGRGYGSALYGTEESLEAIDRKDVLAFIRRFVVKPAVFFCVETDLDRDPLRRLLEESFDSIAEGPMADIPPQEPLLADDRNILLDKDTKQAYIGRAFTLPRTGLPDMARGILLETLLGKGPGSRLWGLRVDQRLAYSVDADLTWTKTAGVLIAYLETGRDKSPEAAAALDRELGALCDSGITDEDLEATRAMARSRFLMSTEAKYPRLRTLGLFEVLGSGRDHAAGICEAIGAVSRDEMNAFIRGALSLERSVRVTVGPGANDRPQGGK